MDFQSEIDLLSSQLNIPNDKFNQIIGAICRNFVKKYQKYPQIDANVLSIDLKKVIREIQIYSQYTCQTISKYKTLNKLENLVRSIIEGQSMVLTYVQNLLCQQLQDRSRLNKKIESMTNRIYERCQNCAKPIKVAEIRNVKDEIGLQFRDIHEYFQHDIDEINKLSQEASLIYRKKALNIEGITEQLYMQKFQKMQQNISTTIEHVTQSLNNITVFQQRFNQMQQYQFIMNKNQKQNVTSQIFNSKRYALDYSKHFYGLIRKLQDKLNKIKTYFIITVCAESQTNNQYNECTPQKLKQLKQQLIRTQAEKRQLQIYVTSLEQQLAQTKIRNKIIQENCSKIKIEKQKSDEKIKYLEAELDMLSKRDTARRRSFQSSQKLIQGINSNVSDKFKQSAINSKNILKNNDIEEDHQNEDENDTIVQQSQMYDNIQDYSKLITDTFNQTRSKRQSKASNSLRKQNEGGYYQKQARNTNRQANNSMTSSLKAKDTFNQVNVYENAKKIAENEFEEENIIIDKPAIKKYRQTKIMDRIQHLDQKKSSISSLKEQAENHTKPTKLKSLKYTKVFEIKINLGKKNKNQQQMSKNKPSKMITQKIDTQRSQKSQESNKENMPKHLTLNEQLQKIYKTLKNTDNIRLNQHINFKQFKSKFNDFINNVIEKAQYVEIITKTTMIQQKKPNDPQQLIKTHSKMKSMSRINQQYMKETRKNKNKFRQGLSGPINEQNDDIQQNKLDRMVSRREKIDKGYKSSNVGYWNKTNTQSNCDEGLLKIKPSTRKSSNTIDQEENPKFFMKLQKYNGFSTTDCLFSNKNFIENLPILKKKYRQQSMNFNLRKSATIEQQIQILNMQNQTCEFNQQDIKIIYHSVENAYEIGQTSLKHRKSQSCMIKDQQSLTSIEINYMKVFFTKMANVHLINKVGYENIKMFLICPYDSIVSQMTQLNLIKSGSYSNAMRESLRKILLLHRSCTVKGEICKHLRHFIGKVAYFQKIKQKDG